MTDKKLIVMSLNEQFPQPSAPEIAAAADRWKSFNPFAWKIYLGVMSKINRVDLWPDHTAELDEYLAGLLVQDELPECPECPPASIWTKTFDFTIANGGWSAVAANNGTWSSGNGWVGSGALAATLHVKRTFTAANVHGMNALINLQATGTKAARLSVLNPTEQFIYSNLNQPNTVNAEISATSPYDNVTEIRVNLTTASGNTACICRRLTLWGEGSNPF